MQSGDTSEGQVEGNELLPVDLLLDGLLSLLNLYRSLVTGNNDEKDDKCGDGSKIDAEDGGPVVYSQSAGCITEDGADSGLHSTEDTHCGASEFLVDKEVGDDCNSDAVECAHTNADESTHNGDILSCVDKVTEDAADHENNEGDYHELLLGEAIHQLTKDEAGHTAHEAGAGENEVENIDVCLGEILEQVARNRDNNIVRHDVQVDERKRQNNDNLLEG